jgi:hypothetical protein
MKGRRWLTVGEGIVANVVAGRKGKVEEQSSDAGSLVREIPVLGELNALERDGHGDEAREHEQGRGHVHDATGEARDDEGDDGGVEQTPAGVGEVDAGGGVVGGVAHHVEEHAGVVADEGVAGELGEEADKGGDEDATAHAARADQIHPRLLRHFHLRLDGLADLDDLGLGEGRVGVSLGVVLDQDGGGLVVAVLGDEVTRGFRKEAVIILRSAFLSHPFHFLPREKDIQDGQDLDQRRADL